MGDVVDLHGHPLILEDHEFIADCARYAENLLSEKDIKKKYHFDDATWESLGNDEKLIEAIEKEKTRRIRSGATARERAQLLYTEVPTVLGNILNDCSASPRHRIEAGKEIRMVAANGPEAAPAADRFQITINLGADTLRFDKSIAIDPNDTDPNDIGTTPQGLLPIIAAKKRDGGDGEPI